MCVYAIANNNTHRKIWLLYKIAGKENGSEMSTKKR